MTISLVLTAAGAFVAGLFFASFFLFSKIGSLKEALRAAQDSLLREQATRQKLEGEFRLAASDALRDANEQFLSAAIRDLRQVKTETDLSLDNKKNLIDRQLIQMKEELEKVSILVSTLEKDRENKFGELTSQLKNTNEQTIALRHTTSTLSEALVNSRARGQWGQRMAEDVLRLAGFAENINYLKEKTIEGIGSRPDITFLLPKNLKLNMDVKFPYDNYVRYLEAAGDTEKDKYKNNFFKDVKAKLKEITSRDYINPEQNTVDYVILFVPNEQIFSFIHEQDPAILDMGIKSRVIFCSPITLFAVLAIIRQAVDNFSLEQTSNEIISLLGSFKSQWLKFLQKLDVVGKRIEDAQKEFNILTTTRKGQLEKPLNKIEALRHQRGIALSSEEDLVELIGDDDKSLE